MMFKNSVKLLCTNFDKVWKLVVFHIICFGICFGLLAVFYNSYIDIAKLAYNEADLDSVLKSGTFYGGTLISAIQSVVEFVLIFFKQIFITSVGQGIYFCFVVFFFLPFLTNIGKYTVCEMMYGYMSSCTKHSFTATFLKTLRHSIAYSCIKVLYALPFNALVVVSIWGLTLPQGGALNYIMPFAFVIVIAAFFAIKEIFISGLAPAKVVYNHNIFTSGAIGTRASFRKAKEVFSTSFVIYLLALVVSIVLGAYSLIIILPIISPLVHIFEMVMFFSSQGMRFYVDSNSIFSPKRLEEVDKIEDAKYLL